MCRVDGVGCGEVMCSGVGGGGVCYIVLCVVSLLLFMSGIWSK